MTRGIDRELIFRDDRDRLDLLNRADLILPESGATCYAWALMPNHTHWVIRTGEISISRILSRLNTGYALYFNRRYNRRGFLFQNRFKSRIVDDDRDLIGLIRYVHRNPVKAGLVKLGDLASFEWSGHGALMGTQVVRKFHMASEALEIFGQDSATARDNLRVWVSEPDPSSDAGEPALLETAQRELETLRRRETDTASRRDEFERLITSVAHRLQLDAEAIRSGSTKRHILDARDLVTYLAATEHGYSGVEIASALGISPSTVSRRRIHSARLLRLYCL